MSFRLSELPLTRWRNPDAPAAVNPMLDRLEHRLPILLERLIPVSLNPSRIGCWFVCGPNDLDGLNPDERPTPWLMLPVGRMPDERRSTFRARRRPAGASRATSARRRSRCPKTFPIAT